MKNKNMYYDSDPLDEEIISSRISAIDLLE